MDLRYVYVYLFVCSVYKFGQSQITCGHLKVVYDNKVNSIDCRIRLYPSIELQTVIVESHFYRWILTRNVSSSTSSKVILQKNSGTYNKTKYNEENFTLLIRNLTPLDVGRYEVECWSSGDVFFNSDKVMVKLPERSTFTPGPAPSVSTSPAEGIGNTTIIVISICVVVVVGIIAGTIYLIISKQRGESQEVKRLVSDEGTSALSQVRHVNNDDPSSFYNEIDTGEMVLDYAKVNKMHMTPVHGSQFKDISVAVQSSNKKFTTATDEDDYDLVNVNVAFVKETDSMEVEYADIIVELPDESIKATDAVGNTDYNYAKVASTIGDESIKATDAVGNTDYNYVKVASTIGDKECDDGAIEIVHESTKPDPIQEIVGAEIYTNDHDNKTPTYAKVSKRKPKCNESNKVETQSLCDEAYSVQFPDINYSEISSSLDDCGYDQQSAQRLQEPAMYSNIVLRPQRDKSRISRASRKELQYAVLDLPGQDSASSLNIGKQYKGHAKLQPCLYDDIDFERKAFVAPIRKAPSSWYRRKKQRRKPTYN